MTCQCRKHAVCPNCLAQSRGIRKVWVKGGRTVTERKGKNGGPVVEQRVELCLVPKGPA